MSDKNDSRVFDWTNKTILIAEDQKINFIILKAIFDKTNATVIWAQDGEEAVYSFLNTDHIDLVIMDYMMPKLNGIEATLQIKKKRHDIPVIFQSTNEMEQEDISSIAYDNIVYFQKPVNPGQLLKKVKDLFGE